MVINDNSRESSEVANKVKLFDQRNSKMSSSKSCFHSMEDLRRSRLKKQSRLYFSIDNSDFKQCDQTRHHKFRPEMSRKRKASGKPQKFQIMYVSIFMVNILEAMRGLKILKHYLYNTKQIKTNLLGVERSPRKQ